VYAIVFNVVSLLPNSYFIGYDGGVHYLPYSSDAGTPGTSLYALCNINSNGGINYDGYYDGIRGIHFGSE
jgi:hypothetical protein